LNNASLNPTSERWQTNGASALQGKLPATPPPSANTQGSNFYFNDNVAWSGKAQSQPPQQGAILNSAAANPQAKTQALNTARGNTLRNQEEQLTRQQMQQQEVPQMQLAAQNAVQPAAPRMQMAPSPQAQTSMVPVPGLPAPPPSSNGTALVPRGVSIGNVTLAPGLLPAPNAPPTQAFGAQIPAQGDQQMDQQAARLQEAGRISLAVDFPTEGQLFHFKKVKANARLGLTLIAPDSLTRWKYLAIALALAAFLAWINRVLDRRRPVAAGVARPGPGTV
jgi:hypothetical protein